MLSLAADPGPSHDSLAGSRDNSSAAHRRSDEWFDVLCSEFLNLDDLVLLSKISYRLKGILFCTLIHYARGLSHESRYHFADDLAGYPRYGELASLHAFLPSRGFQRAVIAQIVNTRNSAGIRKLRTIGCWDAPQQEQESGNVA